MISLTLRYEKEFAIIFNEEFNKVLKGEGNIENFYENIDNRMIALVKENPRKIEEE